MDKTQTIDCSTINWNKLNLEEWRSLEQKMLERDKVLKASRPRKPRENILIPVNILGKVYQLKPADLNRLKTLRSEKSKQKLIEEIISTHNPVETI